jgi:hypothetical protein
MRASEFTINLPVKINLDDLDTETVSIKKPEEEVELDDNPIFIPPLQQDIELKKASVGKVSDVITQLTDTDPDEEPEGDSEHPELSRLKDIIRSITK